MNIEEDFAVAAACLCIANTVPSARRRRKHRRTGRFFLSVLAITIQKQTEILREKTSRGVLVIQICQKSPRYRGDIALNRPEIAEWFTRAILKLQLLGDKNCIELRRQKSPV